MDGTPLVAPILIWLGYHLLAVRSNGRTRDSLSLIGGAGGHDVQQKVYFESTIQAYLKLETQIAGS